MMLSTKIEKLQALGFDVSTDGGISVISDRNGKIIASTSINSNPYYALSKICTEVLMQYTPDNVVQFPTKVLDDK